MPTEISTFSAQVITETWQKSFLAQVLTEKSPSQYDWDNVKETLNPSTNKQKQTNRDIEKETHKAVAFSPGLYWWILYRTVLPTGG